MVRASLFFAIGVMCICGCGGNGTSVPQFPGSGATAVPSANAHATATPVATAVPAYSPSPTPTSVPTSAIAAPTSPPQAAGHTNVVPTQPPNGISRTGQIYNIYVTSSLGETVAMTVFEPSTLTGGRTYPLVLHAGGFGETRSRTLAASGAPSNSAGYTVGNDLTELVQSGYGVISFDQRGMGETGGKIRVMDPDYEGRDYLAVLDWAQANLPWLAYGPTNDGSDPHEPIVGAIGGSYGGMYQVLLANIDKRHRLHAITPNITPGNLSYSLYPGSTPKTLWNAFLFGVGTSTTGNFDPFVQTTFTNDLAADQEDPYASDFFNYHSADYFYKGQTISTNGGAGTTPDTLPSTIPPKVNAMIWIGVRDTLFNFNNGYANYAGFKAGGGDVRLLSYQAGHNSVGAIPDPGVTEYYPSGDASDSRCGTTLNEDQAQLLWFDQYLKMQSGAANAIPVQPCISLSEGDAILVPSVPLGNTSTATSFDVGSISVVAGAQVDVPSAASLYTAPVGGQVYAGIPHAHLQIAATAGISAGQPIIFVGLGQMHASNPGQWDLIDNQVMPVRGIGTVDLDLVGGGARLAAGDQLGLLVYGLQDQFAGTGSINVATPSVEPLTVTGTVSIPLLGSSPATF